MDKLVEDRLNTLDPATRAEALNTIQIRESTLMPWLDDVPVRLTEDKSASATLTVHSVLNQLLQSRCKATSDTATINVDDETYTVESSIYSLLKALVIYSNMCDKDMANEIALLVDHILKHLHNHYDKESLREAIVNYKLQYSKCIVLIDAIMQLVFDATEAELEWNKLNINNGTYLNLHYYSQLYVRENFTTKKELNKFLKDTYAALQKDEAWCNIINACKLTHAQSAMLYNLRDIPKITQIYPESNNGFMSV